MKAFMEMEVLIRTEALGGQMLKVQVRNTSDRTYGKLKEKLP